MSFAAPRVVRDTPRNDGAAYGTMARVIETVRWGILAPGQIARAFAADLRHVPGAEVGAVASRDPSRAAAFASEFGGRAHASYDALVADSEVDVVYVASPHPLHLEQARSALEAGKPVLVEKPITLTRAGAQELVDLARERGVFLMEAMWMACHPLIRELQAGLRDGRWGTPRQVHADLGFIADRREHERLFDPALGASALLDMGIYPVTFAHLMLGAGERWTAVADVTDSGYDLDIAIAGRHVGGGLSALTASTTSQSPRSATIATTEGLIDIPANAHHPAYAVFTDRDGVPHRIDPPTPVLGRGLGNEAVEVQRCLAEGLLESPLVPHEQSLHLMGVLDDLRAQVGVRVTGG
ncbi:MAG: Gfo/Idh/MocA family oxidoreductase [Nocardioides sp.]|jgi:predicted dehydrogenase